MVKLTDRCFCCFTAAMLVPLGRAPTWRFHTKLYKFGWDTFPNNARTKHRTELNLGKVFYVWLIYHIPGSWLNSLNGYDFYFWLRDTANQPFDWINFSKLGFSDITVGVTYTNYTCLFAPANRKKINYGLGSKYLIDNNYICVFF